MDTGRDVLPTRAQQPVAPPRPWPPSRRGFLDSMSRWGPPCVAAVRDGGERRVRNGQAYSTTRGQSLLDVNFDPLSFVLVDDVHDLAAHALAQGLRQLAKLDPFHIGDKARSHLEPDVNEPHGNGDVDRWFPAVDVEQPHSQPSS